MTSLPKCILSALVALLAAASVASAQSDCPECDADGEGNSMNTYHNADVAFVDEETSEVLADTDAAHGHLDDNKGFWAWLSLCASAWFGAVEEALGIDTDTDANAQVYASEDGIDLDAVAYVQGERVSFEETELASLDGETWSVMGDVSATREDAVGEYPTTIPDYDGADLDLCVVCG